MEKQTEVKRLLDEAVERLAQVFAQTGYPELHDAAHRVAEMAVKIIERSRKNG